MKSIDAINIRYTELADSDCCLSCGKAIQFAGAEKGETCLDLGSGRGNDVLRMADQVGPNGFVYGIDLSDGMIRKAKKTAEKLGIKNVEFIHSDLETLPLKCGTVDLVISNCVLNHIENKSKAWAEIYRVIKTGGRFTISDIYSSETVPLEYANDPVAVSECWAGAVTKEVYLSLLEEAGFTQVNILEESKPYEKGKISVVSFTLTGFKAGKCCC
ncbi:methyltransferase domain-containing protein [Oceanispirochaeta sp.]|uniref:methyltransferase domain-containing protein n=1 Tax=Oceanispirochaeta sp. TaxID=2035350 RepID=UPI00261871DC|nr:methyltransferase domain-containing protein [Oceanispirochaeta sp.]MDA3958107.1 methyltransferase domain-containing protein [Oceanispirochaeta sp.]